MLRIWDVYPGSRIRLFSIPNPGSELSPSRIPDPHQSILTPKKPKKWFLSSRKYDPGCSYRIPDADFLPIPDPGSRGQKGTGSRIRIRNTGFMNCFLFRNISDKGPYNQSISEAPIFPVSVADPDIGTGMEKSMSGIRERKKSVIQDGKKIQIWDPR